MALDTLKATCALLGAFAVAAVGCAAPGSAPGNLVRLPMLLGAADDTHEVTFSINLPAGLAAPEGDRQVQAKAADVASVELAAFYTGEPQLGLIRKVFPIADLTGGKKVKIGGFKAGKVMIEARAYDLAGKIVGYAEAPTTVAAGTEIKLDLALNAEVTPGDLEVGASITLTDGIKLVANVDLPASTSVVTLPITIYAGPKGGKNFTVGVHRMRFANTLEATGSVKTLNFVNMDADKMQVMVTRVINGTVPKTSLIHVMQPYEVYSLTFKEGAKEVIRFRMGHRVKKGFVNQMVGQPQFLEFWNYTN
ncbi:MAG: hypothetical protein FJZ01_01850 [Candidatus Sericytochromatia bacterium]|nr:hypothetical protein [Candidatus Tanganyikabacteria bacterium]